MESDMSSNPGYATSCMTLASHPASLCRIYKMRMAPRETIWAHGPYQLAEVHVMAYAKVIGENRGIPDTKQNQKESIQVRRHHRDNQGESHILRTSDSA